jgi:hypothetical protein
MSKAAVWADPYAVARVVQAITASVAAADKLEHEFCIITDA